MLECLDYCLTKEEGDKFERDGFLVVKNVLPIPIIENLIEAVDIVTEKVDAVGGRHKQVIDVVKAYVDFVGKDDIFLDLVDWYKVFPKVWGILGWNIHLYVTHITLTPPISLEDKLATKELFWHQDNGRVSLDVGMTPAPRISVKVGYFLTDCSEKGRGNFSVIPGSHLTDEVEHSNVHEVQCSAGDAIIFDRRVLHAGGFNLSDITRKALFFGYSHRWFHIRDERTVSHYMEICSPIQRQLLGYKTGNLGLTRPDKEDVPLREWMREHLGEGSIGDGKNRNLT